MLRIPVLYGPVEYLEESAVTVLFKLLLSPSDKDVVSDYEIRRPSHVDDIAHVVQKLLEAKHKVGQFAIDTLDCVSGSIKIKVETAP